MGEEDDTRREGGLPGALKDGFEPGFRQVFGVICQDLKYPF